MLKMPTADGMPRGTCKGGTLLLRAVPTSAESSHVQGRAGCVLRRTGGPEGNGSALEHMLDGERAGSIDGIGAGGNDAPVACPRKALSSSRIPWRSIIWWD